MTNYGQARKSLWIETGNWPGGLAGAVGQARKSLWIETSDTFLIVSATVRSGS